MSAWFMVVASFCRAQGCLEGARSMLQPPGRGARGWMGRSWVEQLFEFESGWQFELMDFNKFRPLV